LQAHQETAVLAMLLDDAQVLVPAVYNAALVLVDGV
jgi:hypothetical protein